jgi:hypothetical protein
MQYQYILIVHQIIQLCFVCFIIIGAGAHASIFIIVDQQAIKNYSFSFILLKVLNHRDLIIGHLIWVTIALGLHSFSIYIHNDCFVFIFIRNT